ncbi:s68306 pol retrotransposon woot [Lasius niger]|uniref:RNA-directed DNA polymerase n=1 Tax=Lasius niger TaxID=67767 RepID=A0A0J7KJB1_LASNI|nr:s68306 pol retrotransposon woot [Lasius niger]
MPLTPKSPPKDDGGGVVTRSQTRADATAKSSDQPEDFTLVLRSEVDAMRKSIADMNARASRRSVDNALDESGRKRDDLLVTMITDIARRLDKLEVREQSREWTRERGVGVADHARQFSAEERGVDAEDANHMALIGNVRLPRGGWLKDPFDGIRYTGRSDAQNPMKFLKKFLSIARYEGIREDDQLHYFAKCLRGSAANWFELRDPVDMRDAIRSFRDQFWNDEHQARFREVLYTGRYNRRESKMTMAEYALDLSRQARLLDPPLSEPEIIRCVKRHYGVRVSREIRPTTVSNLDDFIKLLDDLEADMNFEREDRVAENRAGMSSKYNDLRGRTIAANVNSGRYDARQTARNSIPGDRLRAIEADAYKDKPKPKCEREQRVKITEITNDNDAKKFSSVTSKNGNSLSRKKVALIDRDNEDVDDREGDSFREEDDERAEVNEINDDDYDRENDAESMPMVSIMRTKELIRDVDEVSIEDQGIVARRFKPYLWIHFDEIRVRCLIDTGAQISAITKRVYDKLIEARVRVRAIPIRKFTLVGAFSDKGEVIANKIQVNFSIAERDFAYNLYVVKNLAYDMVLGMDFLSENNSILRCREGKFEVEFDVGSRKTVRSMNAISVADANDRLNDILLKHEEIFRDEIGRVNNYEHRIRLTSRAPYKSKTYPIPEIHRERVKSHLLDMENTGIIERTSSQYINPLVVVVKKTGEIRLCLDARELNRRMENDHDQPPTIDEIFRRIGTKKYFSTLDVSKAFWQIPLRRCDRQYTGFTFDNQTYVFKRLPFGIKTAGASFTRAINSALGDDCHEFTLVYLDDILIASNSLEEHLRHLDIIFDRLKRCGYRLNRDKCELLRTEIRFLGHTFDEIKVEMNAETKSAIQNFAKPRNKKAIQAFLGLVNWDRRFIRNLSRMTRPLEELLKKNQKFVWREEQQNAFNEIKAAFGEADNLFVIRSDFRFGIYVDASKRGLGARLYQYRESDPDEKFTVSYASRSLKGAELNYTVTELECLALVWALRKWYVTLLGRHVKVHTDHMALKFITSCADDSSRIARWLAFLREFDLEIEHIPGKENIIADTLSRSSREIGKGRKDAAVKTIAAIDYPDDNRETSEWVELVAEAQAADVDLRTDLAENPQRYVVRDNLIRVKEGDEDRIVVPEAVKWKLIRRIHDYLLHFGTDKVASFIRKFFAMGNLERFVRDVVASCHICLATNTGYPPVELHPDVGRVGLRVDPRLVPSSDNVDPEGALRDRLQMATETLRARAQQRKIQADKHGVAHRYEVGSKVWVKLHRRSDANRRVTRKIHLVYSGPYSILREIRRNAYLVGDSDGRVVGAFNSRQLRPHREARLDPEVVRIEAIDAIAYAGACEYSCEEENEMSLSRANEVSPLQPDDCIIVSSDEAGSEMSDEPSTSTAIVRRSRKTRRKYRLRKPVTEKGIRHIRRIYQILTAKEGDVFSAKGSLMNLRTKIIFDRRGEFDVVTTTAVDKLKEADITPDYVTDLKRIPVYLQQQRRIRVLGINALVGIRSNYINAQLMMLQGNEACVLLGRHSTEKLFLQVMHDQRGLYRRRTLLDKGQERIAEWKGEEARALLLGFIDGVEDRCRRNERATENQSCVQSDDTLPCESSNSEEDSEPRPCHARNVDAWKRDNLAERLRAMWSSDEEEDNAGHDGHADPREEEASCGEQSAGASDISVRDGGPKSLKTRKTIISDSDTSGGSERDAKGTNEDDSVIIVSEIIENVVSSLPADNSGGTRRSVESDNLDPKTGSKVSATNRAYDGESAQRADHSGVKQCVKDTNNVNSVEKTCVVRSNNARKRPWTSVNSTVIISGAKKRHLSTGCGREVRMDREHEKAVDPDDPSDDVEAVERLSTEEINRRSEVLLGKITRRIESNMERHRALERYRILQRLSEHCEEVPTAEELQERAVTEESVSREIMEAIVESYKRSAATRVLADEIDLVDESNKPLYSLSTAISMVNKQPSTDKVAPVCVQYFLKGGLIHRSYTAKELTLPDIPSIGPQEVQIRDEEVPVESTEVVTTSTPVTKEKPRIVSCITGSFLDGGPLPKTPSNKNQKLERAIEAVLDPQASDFAHSLSIASLLEDDPGMETSATGSGEPSISGDTGFESGIRTSDETRQVVKDATKKTYSSSAVKSKAARRSPSKSRQTPLAGEMQPTRQPAKLSTRRPSREKSAASSDAERPSGQPRVVLDRMRRVVHSPVKKT